MVLTVVSHLQLDLFICVSFGVFQAKESIDQLVYICRTDKEEVREAAKQTLLVLGEAVYLHSQMNYTTVYACHHTCVCVCFDHVC